MTFCLGIKVEEGLIGIADTRITSGTERITASKVTVHQNGEHSLFLMTSGLRSIRDKALTYFEQVLEETHGFPKLYLAVNALASQIRQVAKEDKAALEEAGLHFNLHALVGGQLKDDKEHKLYMIYPQGNWVEVSSGSPYSIIGESGFGRSVLDRLLHHETDLVTALKAGALAFNATITCAVNVDYPIDLVLYRKGSYQMKLHRFYKDDLADFSKKWLDSLRASLQRMPDDWLAPLVEREKV
jgi:putative proteasome-type protease